MPYVLHVHNGDLARYVAEDLGPARRWLVRRIMHGAGAVIALTPSLGAQLAALIGQSANVTVLPNPALIDQPVGDPARRLPGRILFIGNLTPNKGILDLLEGAAPLVREGKVMELRCAGTGSTTAATELARSLGIENRVTMLGWIDGEQRAQELAAATMLVLPSHTEGQPMVLLEAMAAGTPVVATRVGGIPDTVTHEREALLVEARQPEEICRSIRRLLEEPGLGQRLAEAARVRVVSGHDPARLRKALAVIHHGVMNSTFSG